MLDPNQIPNDWYEPKDDDTEELEAEERRIEQEIDRLMEEKK
jgi:hypothetical protein